MRRSPGIGAAYPFPGIRATFRVPAPRPYPLALSGVETPVNLAFVEATYALESPVEFSKRVLIVDDEDPLREFHRRLQCIRGFDKRQIHRSLDARERQRVRPGCRHAEGSTNARTRIGSTDAWTAPHRGVPDASLPLHPARVDGVWEASEGKFHSCSCNVALELLHLVDCGHTASLLAFCLRGSRVIRLTSVTRIELRTLFDPCPLDRVTCR